MKWQEDDLDLTLGALREEDPPPAVMAVVRARVMERIERRRAWLPWSWLAFAATAAVVVLMVTYQPLAPVATLRVGVAVVPAVPEEALRPPVVQAVTPRVASQRRREVVASRDFVHLMTDDPDVVILWAVESKGDTE